MGTAFFPGLPKHAGNCYDVRVMSTVSEQLRQAREAKKLTEQQVVEITKIRTDHLRALEEGNFDVFSAPVYIRGFVRSYATLLKLDVPQIMAALDAELSGTTKFAEPPSLAEHPNSAVDFLMLQLSKVDWRKVLIGLGIVIAVVAVGSVWANWRHRNPLKGLKPGVYQPAHGTSGDTLPLPGPAPHH
jgi:cytoskeletal protein RodZ